MEKEIEEAQLPPENDSTSIRKDPPSTSSTISSSQTVQYLKIMGSLINTHLTETFKEALRREGITHDVKPFRKDMQLVVKQTTVNHQVAVLNLQWGSFGMDITLLNIAGNNCKHPAAHGSGAFASVYVGWFLKRLVAVKCIPIRSDSTRFRALKELFLMKIASALEVGPKLDPVCGFDLFFYESCVEVPMEVCQNVNGQLENLEKTFSGLGVLHSLRIVHGDIKPQNLMVSSSFKKVVFIDFGLSRIIEEAIGLQTLTEFAGSLKFCSKEMAQCFLEKEQRLVDLYFNDLFSLQASLKALRSRTSEKDSYEDDPAEDYATEVLSFFGLHLLKFYVYSFQTEGFFSFWQKYQFKYGLNSYRREIMEFVLQIMPNRQTKDLFWRFAKGTDEETTEYSRIKKIYEATLQNFSSSFLLHNDEKAACFLSYLAQIGKEGDLQNRKEDQLRAVRELVLSETAIRKVSLKQYFDAYLQFTSYIRNFHQADAALRERSAKIFYSTQIDEAVPPELHGRNLVEETVRHVLQWLCSLKGAAESQFFTVMAFKIYDFMAILEMGTASEYLSWLSLMVEHQLFINKFKCLFFNRVCFSSVLNFDRLTKKGDMNRVEFVYLLYKWVTEQRLNPSHLDQIKDFQLDDSQSVGRVELSECTDLDQMNFLDYTNIRKTVVFENFKGKFTINEDYMEAISRFSSHISRSSSPGFFYSMLQIFREFYPQSHENWICKKIYSIFSQNIADSSILEQFSFGFKLKICANLFAPISTLDIGECLKEVSEFFQKVDTADLINYKFIFSVLFNKVVMCSYHKKQWAEGEEFNIFRRLVSSFLKFLRKQLLQHSITLCAQDNFYSDLYFFCKKLQFQIEETRQFFKEDFILKMSCPHCQTILRMSRHLINMLDLVQQLGQGGEQQKEDIIDRLLDERNELLKLRKEQLLNEWIDSMVVGLSYLQMICCLEEEKQAKYHGILHFYEFASPHNRIIAYFKRQLMNTFPMLCTLKVLIHHHNQHVDFLLRMARELRQSLLIYHYHVILTNCIPFFRELSEPQRYQLFQDLKRANLIKLSPCLRNSEDNPYLAVILGLLIGIVESVHFQRKLLSYIMKIVHRLHSKFQRVILVRFISKRCKDIFKETPDVKLSREFQFLNSQLTKNLIVSDIFQIKKFKMRKGKRGHLTNKLEKIGLKNRLRI